MSRETYRGSFQPQDSPGLGANRRPAFWTCAGDVPGEVVEGDGAEAVGLASCMFARPGQEMARSSFPPEWAWRDSNPRPSDYESPALTTELQAPFPTPRHYVARNRAFLQCLLRKTRISTREARKSRQENATKDRVGWGRLLSPHPTPRAHEKTPATPATAPRESCSLKSTDRYVSHRHQRGSTSDINPATRDDSLDNRATIAQSTRRNTPHRSTGRSTAEYPDRS